MDAPLYVVHVMAAGAAAAVGAARAAGQRVIGEAVVSGTATACPPLDLARMRLLSRSCAGIVLDDSATWQPDFTAAAAAVMSPPIRKLAVDGAALKGALVGGVLGPLGTDHCAFNSTQKARAGVFETALHAQADCILACAGCGAA